MVVVVDCAVVPSAARTVYSAFVVVKVHNADTVDVPAGQAKSRCIDAGLTVHVAPVAGKSSVGGVLAVGTNRAADRGRVLKVVVGVGRRSGVGTAGRALGRQGAETAGAGRVAGSAGVVAGLPVKPVRTGGQTGVPVIVVINSRHVPALLADRRLVHAQHARQVAGPAAKVRQNRVLSRQTVRHAPIVTYFLVVTYVSRRVLLARLAVQQVTGLAGKTTSRAGLAKSGGLAGVVALGTGRQAAVGGPVEVKPESAVMGLGAVGRHPKTADALDRTALAHVRVPCPSVLPQRTLQGANGVANVEVKDQSIGRDVGSVGAALTLEQGRSRALQTTSLARLTGVVRGPGVAASAALLDAGRVL